MFLVAHQFEFIKFRIVCYCFFRQAQLKKSKQIFEIWHVQIDELPWTLVYAFIWLLYSDKSESFEEYITLMHYFVDYIIWFTFVTTDYVCGEKVVIAVLL